MSLTGILERQQRIGAELQRQMYEREKALARISPILEAGIAEILAPLIKRAKRRPADKRYREKQKAKRQKAIRETSQKLREELAA